MSILSQAHVRYSPASYILQILKGCEQDVPSIQHIQDPFPINKNSRPILKTSSVMKPDKKCYRSQMNQWNKQQNYAPFSKDGPTQFSHLFSSPKSSP